MIRRMVFLLMTACLLAFSACSVAPPEPLAVTDAWVRPAPAGQNSAIYFQIDNPNTSPDSLLSASTSVAQATELHKSEMDSSGVMSMHPQRFCRNTSQRSGGIQTRRAARDADQPEPGSGTWKHDLADIEI